MFARLREILTTTLADSSWTARFKSPESNLVLSRRRWLAAQAALLTSGCSSPNPVGTPITPPDEPRVAIVGAGVAGLSCAYWLNQARIDVSVYEAHPTRVGGRTFTARNLFGANPALACDFGAEFVEPYHAAVWTLARELQLSLELRSPQTSQGRIEVFWLGGKLVAEATIAAQLSIVSERITRALSDANQDERLFFQLDNTSLGTWLSENVPARDFPELALALTLAFRGEFGLEVEQQSALNLVHLISDALLPSYQVLGQARSTYRVRGGADLLASQLASALLGRVRLDSQLVSIERSGAQHALTFQTRTGGGLRAAADRVVLAMPFSVLRNLPLGALELSGAVRDVIETLGYGTHCRTIGAFTQPTWRATQARGSVTSDLPFQQVWDATSGTGDSREGLLAITQAGALAEAEQDSNVQLRYRALLGELDAIFPNVSLQYIENSARRVHWKKQAFSRGSRSCRLPGQWATRALPQVPHGNVRFCGEHCSIDFPGTLEGAAESGALVAGQLILELGHKLPAALERLLRVKNQVAQPCCSAVPSRGATWPIDPNNSATSAGGSDGLFEDAEAGAGGAMAAAGAGAAGAEAAGAGGAKGATLGFLERLRTVLQSHAEFTNQLEALNSNP